MAAVQLLFNGGGAVSAVVAVIGILLVATHWGWVHVAEYVGLTIDEHQQRDDRSARAAMARDGPAVSALQRLDERPRRRVDACRTQSCTGRSSPRSTRSRSFVRRTPRRRSTPMLRPRSSPRPSRRCAARRGSRPTVFAELWEAASSAYAAALFSAEDEQQRLAAQRAAATALSEHINASLLEPPLVE